MKWLMDKKRDLTPAEIKIFEDAKLFDGDSLVKKVDDNRLEDMGLKPAKALVLMNKIRKNRGFLQSPPPEKSYDHVELTDLFNFENNNPAKFEEDIFKEELNFIYGFS